MKILLVLLFLALFAVCCMFTVRGFLTLLDDLPDGDVNNKLATEKYRKKVKARTR